jgi:hypothetical protein
VATRRITCCWELSAADPNRLAIGLPEGQYSASLNNGSRNKHGFTMVLDSASKNLDPIAGFKVLPLSVNKPRGAQSH